MIVPARISNYMKYFNLTNLILKSNQFYINETSNQKSIK